MNACPLSVRTLSRLPLALATGVAALLLIVTPLQAEETLTALQSQAETLAHDSARAPEGLRIEIETGRLDPRLKLAPCARTEAYLPTGFKPWGRTRVGLRCLQGERLWNVFLPITVKVFGPGLVAATALPAGTALTENDLVEGEVDLAAAHTAVLRDPALAVGRTLTRSLAAGQALRENDIRARQWFAAGDTVRVSATGPGFAVHGEGRALGAGIEGRPVRVRTESGRIVTGLAVADRQVEVPL